MGTHLPSGGAAESAANQSAPSLREAESRAEAGTASFPVSQPIRALRGGGLARACHGPARAFPFGRVPDARGAAFAAAASSSSTSVAREAGEGAARPGGRDTPWLPAASGPRPRAPPPPRLRPPCRPR